MLTQTWGSVFIYRYTDIYLCISTISMILLNPYYIPQGNGTLHNILYFKLTKRYSHIWYVFYHRLWYKNKKNISTVMLKSMLKWKPMINFSLVYYNSFYIFTFLCHQFLTRWVMPCNIMHTPNAKILFS